MPSVKGMPGSMLRKDTLQYLMAGARGIWTVGGCGTDKGNKANAVK